MQENTNEKLREYIEAIVTMAHSIEKLETAIIAYTALRAITKKE